jgi:hypothetical protein
VKIEQISKTLDDPINERIVCRGTIDGKVVLLCRQVDDIAVACPNPTAAQGFIAAKILSILIELGFLTTGLTLLYEDNNAAINMVNANRPTERVFRAD